MSLINFFKQIVFWVDVTGDSMSPVLKSDRSYLASSLLKPKVGRIVVFKNPQNEAQIMVKKIVRQKLSGFEVAGTSSSATSSKEIGLVKSDLILGVLFEH